MEKVDKNIVFFYPSKIVGGAEYLFMRSALFLANEMSLSVKYIDYEDGFVAKQLSETKVEVIPFNDYRKTKVPSNSVIICPLSSVFDVVFDLYGYFKVLLWSIHPVGLNNAIQSYTRYSRNGGNILYNDIQFLIDSESVVFMDGANLDYQKNKFQFHLLKEEFVPIFCISKRNPKVTKKVFADVIHLGWLGRLCIEKVFPLINVLQHLKKYAIEHSTEKIVFHIIGDGEEKERVVQEQLPNNVEIRYLGVLVGKELDDYIYEYIDVMFGMGTSTLEVASLRKAVILVDYSFNEMKLSNNFRWLYESERFSVGDEYHIDTKYDHSFKDIIDAIKNDELSDIAELCYGYFRNNHTIESVCHSLVQKSEQTLLTSKILLQTNFKKFWFIDFLKKVNKIRKKVIK